MNDFENTIATVKSEISPNLTYQPMKKLIPTFINSCNLLVRSKLSSRTAKVLKFSLAALALAACIATFSASAQQAIAITPGSGGTTLGATKSFMGANFNPINSVSLIGNYTTNITFRASFSGGSGEVDFSASGMPAGATVFFSTNAVAAAPVFSSTLALTNSATFTFVIGVTNAAKGVYPLTISASGAASTNIVVTLIVGDLWTNQSTTAVSWGTAGNWSTGIPGPSDDVMFQDAGLNTNFVDNSYTISSLSYIRSISGSNHNTTISSGSTLSVLGTNGFVITVDGYNGGSKTLAENFYGSGATLLVSNLNANFTVNGLATATTVNMTNLDNLTAVVNRIGLGDVILAKQGAVGQNLMTTFLAKTNFVEAFFSSDYTTTNALAYSISMVNNSDSYNNGSVNTINMGLTNVFLGDSFGFAQSRAGGANLLQFATVFRPLSPVAYFRNTNGGPVSLIAVCAASGVSATGSNTKGTMDFTGGIVDMLANTIWLGRNNFTNTASQLAAGKMTVTTNGIVNVSLMRLGYQEYTNDGGAQGTLTLNGGTVNVSSNLELGYTAGSLDNNANVAAGFGQVVINNGGAVRANNITVGQLSANDTISLTAGGTLDVTNNIADTNKSLTTLTINASSLNLHVNGTSTLVYVTNLTTVGAATINISSVAGLGSFPVTVPLIAYTTLNGSAPAGGTVAGGLSMTIANNSVNKTIDATFTIGSPKSLLWKGFVNGNWDTSTKNWQDLNTGLQTNFSTGDNVVFDDTASQNTVTLVGDLVPRQSVSVFGIAMTNNSLAYTFTGSGRLLGSASLFKTGANSLTVDAATESAVTVDQGSLTNTGSGTIGSGTVSAGATLTVASGGKILGNLSSAGMSINAGTVNGSVTIQSSGIVTNAPGGLINGALVFQSGSASILCNMGTLANVGTTSVTTNATFINFGPINGGVMDVAGTFEDEGLNQITFDTLTIDSGGTFIPGGDGIGTTIIASNGQLANNGKIILATGSTNIFKVDMAGPSATVIEANRIVLGPSQNTLVQNGGILLISNVGVTPFSNGQTLQLFLNSSGGTPLFDAGLNTTNALSVISPGAPAASGLAWDLSQEIHGGSIGIKTTPTVGTNIVFNVSFTQTISTNIPPVTNNFIVNELSWPAAYIGWKLQTQQNPLSVGLTNNWTTIAPSLFVNDIIISNTISGGTAVFYRMVSQ